MDSVRLILLWVTVLLALLAWFFRYDVVAWQGRFVSAIVLNRITGTYHLVDEGGWIPIEKFIPTPAKPRDLFEELKRKNSKGKDDER